MLYIDEAEVERCWQEEAAKHAHHLEENTSVGVQTRVQREVLRAYHLAMVREINRGAKQQHLEDAIAALMTNMVLSYVGGLSSVVDDGDPTPGIIRLTERYFECVKEALPRLHTTPRVPARRCGKA